MKDIQASVDGFPKIAINKVGVRNIELPVRIIVPNSTDYLSVIASMSSYCDLVDDLKGINMSRIERTLVPIFLNEKGLVTELSERAVKELAAAHNTNHIYLKIKFKYVIRNDSPVTNIESPEIANVEIETKLINNQLRQFMTVETVGMSLCPCSKEMSMLMNNLTMDESDALLGAGLPASVYQKLEQAGFGAHNQKSYVKVTVELNPHHTLYIEDLVKVINESVSAPTYSVLKRPDEKYVTEVSYMGGYYDDEKKFCPVDGYGAKFVEDIVRQVADKLNNKFMGEWISDYVIVVRNQESIHSNDIEAVAVLSAGKDLG